MERIGYINRHLYTDTESWAVYQENGGALYAKRIAGRLIKADHDQGGFIAHIENPEYELREEGDLIPIVKRYGAYGCWVSDGGRHFVKLGKAIEPKCRYFSDPNF